MLNFNNIPGADNSVIADGGSIWAPAGKNCAWFFK